MICFYHNLTAITLREERRSFTRIQLELPATLYLFQAEINYTGSILDLSQGGCFFPVSDDLSPGEPCQIKLTIGEGLKAETIGFAGVVARTDDKGVGIQFINTTEENQRRLVKILASHIPH